MKDKIENLLSETFSEPIRILGSSSCGGGCINRTEVLSLSNGEKAFLKSHPNPPQNFFHCEARGLDLLRSAENGPSLPTVLGIQPSTKTRFILLEHIAEEPPCDKFYIGFGRAMAALHRKSHDHYGLDHNNYIGKTPQKNTLEKDPIIFFREYRIRFQQELARQSRLLPVSLDKSIDKLCSKLHKLLDITGEKPALLHGDLWSGNYFSGPRQTPYIFDPATHFGLREADLAMTELFESLPKSFYSAYNEAFPLNPGYAERKNLYNLYHLLNHLNLFGGSYLSSVENTVNYFN